MVFGLARSSSRQGLREFDPGSDLRAVADLIEVAFRDDLSAADLEVIRSIRSAALLGPLITLVGALFPTLRQALQGFVWVQDGQVVGNVSWGPAPGVEGYVISNVAVHPDYRRRGIARRLMERTLQELELAKGSLVSLEVGQDNLPAIQLYENLGFEPVGARTEFRRRDVPALEPASDEPMILPLAGDRWKAYEGLVAAAVSESERDLGPPEEIRIRPGWLGRLLMGAGMRRVEGWAAKEEEDGSLLAALTLRADPLAGRARLVMVVRPEARGKVELALLGQARETLPDAFQPGAGAVLYPSYPEGVAILDSAGFEPIRTLERMMKRLNAA